MTRKASVVIEKDEHGFYAWCPELEGCQSQGTTIEEALANIREAIELYLETLPAFNRAACPTVYCAIDFGQRETEVNSGSIPASPRVPA